MDFLKVEPDSDETCHDGNQVMDIKDEDVTDMQENEDPVLMTLPVQKAEQEVCLWLRYCLFSSLSVCLSIHMKQLPYGEWILKSPFQNVCRGLYFVAHCLQSISSRQSLSQY
jgi:hypothetical protein